jgi:sugar lactone lactonase YvrE
MRTVIAILVAVMLGAVTSSSAGAAPPFPERIDLPDGFRPEGIAIGRGHTVYVGSIPTGAIYRGSLRTGEGAVLVPAQPGRAAIGLKVDSRNRLFVAGGPTGDGYVYDAATGATLAIYDFASAPTFVNDVVVTRTAAWFTDSMQPVLYRVPIAPDGTLGTQADVETVALSGDFVQQPGFNLNGIDATPNGDLLVVVQSNTGKLFTVDPDSGVTEEIDLGGATVMGGDGILLAGKTLYVVRNVANELVEIRLASDFASGEVMSRTTSPLFDVPTTVAAFGSSLYFVNARFTTPPTPATEYWISKLAKP